MPEFSFSVFWLATFMNICYLEVSFVFLSPLGLILLRVLCKFCKVEQFE